MEKKNIMVVEDEPETLQTLLHMIDGCCPMCHEVYGYTKLQDVYHCMEQHEIFLFIVDLGLGRNSGNGGMGYEFVEKLRRTDRYRHAPVIAIGVENNIREHAYRELHCLGCLQKPLQEEEVYNLLPMCLDYPIQNKEKRIRIKQEGIYVLLDMQQIVSLKTERKCLYIKLKTGEVLEYSYVPMKDILNQMTSEKMVLCKKGIAVNAKYIDYVKLKERKVYMKDDPEPIDVGSSYMSKLIHSVSSVLP